MRRLAPFLPSRRSRVPPTGSTGAELTVIVGLGCLRRSIDPGSYMKELSRLREENTFTAGLSDGRDTRTHHAIYAMGENEVVR